MPRRLTSMMALVAVAGVAAAVMRLRGGVYIIPWLVCGWLLARATRPPPAEPEPVSPRARLVREVLDVALPYLVFLFLVLTLFLGTVLLDAAGCLPPEP